MFYTQADIPAMELKLDYPCFLLFFYIQRETKSTPIKNLHDFPLDRKNKS